MLSVCLRNDTWWILIFLDVDSNAAPDSSEASILAEISSSKGEHKNSQPFQVSDVECMFVK